MDSNAGHKDICLVFWEFDDGLEETEGTELPEEEELELDEQEEPAAAAANARLRAREVERRGRRLEKGAVGDWERGSRGGGSA